MNRLETELIPGFRRSNITSIKGDRTRHLVTMNPSSAQPSDEIYLDIPKLKQASCLVPGSLHLVFDMVITGTKTHYMTKTTTDKTSW